MEQRFDAVAVGDCVDKAMQQADKVVLQALNAGECVRAAVFGLATPAFMFAATAAPCVSWTVSVQKFFFSTFVRFAETLAQHGLWLSTAILIVREFHNIVQSIDSSSIDWSIDNWGFPCVRIIAGESVRTSSNRQSRSAAGFIAAVTTAV